MGIFQKLFGTHSERELKLIYPIADKIESIRNTYIANFGQSGKVGGRYILQQLTKKK